MIVSELVADQRVLRHKLVGSITVLDISRAMIVKSLHPALPVLWDFRQAPATEDNLKLLQHIPTFIAFSRSTSPEQKSAYLVKTEPMRQELELLLGSSSLTWPWAVFIDEEQSLDWILHEPGG